MTVQFSPKTGSRGIERCDRTENVIGGCLHRCRWKMPDGTIAMCYAENLAESGVAKSGYPHGFEHHYWRNHSLKSLVAGKKKPELIFIDSMSDLFGHWIPEVQVQAVLEAMASAPHRTYQSLTKAPGRLAKFMPLFPKNLWVGVSSPPDYFMPEKREPDPVFADLHMKPSQSMPLKSKIRFLQKTLRSLHDVKKGAGCVVWMSLEPVSWDMAPYMENHQLDWVVIGAASNRRKYYQPNPEHIQKLLDLFDATNTPVFFKGNLKWHPRRENFPVVPGWDAAVCQRQEMAIEHGWPLNEFLSNEETDG